MLFKSAVALVAAVAPLVSADLEATSTKPSRIYANESAKCTSWYIIEQGDTCEEIIGAFKISYNTLYTLNPDINNNCTNLKPGYGVCVSTVAPTTMTTSVIPKTTAAPTNTTSSAPKTTDITNPPKDKIRKGVIDSCKKYHSVVPDDTCDKISRDANVTLTEFLKWNNEDWACNDLQLGSYVCIGV